MFFLKKLKNETKIMSVCDGESFPLENVKDTVFSQKMMGDGIAFKVIGNRLVSPCSGEIISVFPGGHAYGIRKSDGMELMIHFGLETISLKGKGIQLKVKIGQKIDKGQDLCDLDMDYLIKTNLDLTTMLIITKTNNKQFKKSKYGNVNAGETTVMNILS